MGSARNSRDSTQNIGCAVRGGGSSNPYTTGSCSAFDADGKIAFCSFAYSRAGYGFSRGLVEFETGLVFLSLGQLDDAIARFNTALRLGAAGNRAPAHVWIALALLGEAETAREVLRDVEARWVAGDTLQVGVSGGCFWTHFYLGELDRAYP